jgi:hypothetical protein
MLAFAYSIEESQRNSVKPTSAFLLGHFIEYSQIFLSKCTGKGPSNAGT